MTTKKNGQADQEKLNQNLGYILGFLIINQYITQEQFSDMKYLIKELTDNNEDEVMTIISPMLDKILVIENKQSIMIDESNFLDALVIVFPDKAEAWKQLVKDEIMDSLTKKQKKAVNALLSHVLTASAATGIPISNEEFRGWKKLIDIATDKSQIIMAESFIIGKFNSLTYEDLQKTAPSILAYIQTNIPERFAAIKAQYIKDIKQ